MAANYAFAYQGITSYEAVGIKEDISDIITNISPTKTPFQSSIGREKVTQKLFQWQEDSLRSVLENAQIEGFDATFSPIVPTVMRNNNTQIFAQTVAVTGSMEATSTYGRARESAYQLALAAQAVKRDLEVALCGLNRPAATIGSNYNSTVTTYAGTARQMWSYNGGLQFTNGANNVPVATTTAAPQLTNPTTGTIFYSGFAAFNTTTNTWSYASTNFSTTATAVALNEGALIQALEACYNNGAEPTQIMVTPQNAVSVAGFAKSANRYRFIQDNEASSAKTVVNAVDLYASPFGEVRVYLNRFQGGAPLAQGMADSTTNQWTLVLDPSMWVLTTLRSWFREVLAKTGDSIKQMIVGEFGLKMKNFKASALIVDTGAATATTPGATTMMY